MTEKADRGLVRAEETVGSFHQKKETEKQPQLPTLPHFARCWAGLTPQGVMFVGMWPEGTWATLCCPPERPGRPGGGASVGLHPVPPTQPHSLGA